LELKLKFQSVSALLQQYLPKDENDKAMLEIKLYTLIGNLELKAEEATNATVNIES
jgi:hypothetical protein